MQKDKAKLQKDYTVKLTESEYIDIVCRRILQKYLGAFKELAEYDKI